MKTEIPVLLLTGYLGSGKTTLLNRILTNRRGIRFAVIVNDIGEVNIDANLIQRGGIVGQQDDSLVALQNGCICCTLKTDLMRQLGQLLDMAAFDYIVIEASGICEPAPIAQTICMMPRVAPEYTQTAEPRLDCICTVVDALRLRDEFASGEALTAKDIDEEDVENLVIEQIEFCDLILLNKASEVTPAELGRIRAVVQAIQPKARIIECDYCDVDLNLLLNTHLFSFERAATSAAWVEGVESSVEDMDDEDDRAEHAREHHHHEHEHAHEHHHHEHDHDHDEHDHGHHHHHHHHHHDGEGEAEEYGIGTFVYYARRPMDLNKFDWWVHSSWPREVLRAKGVCYFSEDPDMSFLFEQAGSQKKLTASGQWYATAPADELEQFMKMDPTLRRDWDPLYGDRMQKLVFIGQHMDRSAITAALDACLTDYIPAEPDEEAEA